MKDKIDIKVTQLKIDDFSKKKAIKIEKEKTSLEKEDLTEKLLDLLLQDHKSRRKGGRGFTDTFISQQLNLDDRSIIQYTRDKLATREQELFPIKLEDELKEI